MTFNRMISVFLLLVALAPACASAAVIGKPVNNLGLIGYWSFNEGTSTVAQDFSGNGNTGALTVSPLPTWVAGKLDKALSFVPSSANRVTLSSASALNPAAFTITGWIKPRSTGDNTYDIIYSNAPDCCTTGKGIMFGYWGGAMQGTIWNTTANGITGTAIPNDQWTFAAFSYNGTTMKLYQNGVQSATPITYGGGVGQPASYNAVIGGLPYSSYSMNGSLDEVRLYNRALSDTEIATLYRSGSLRIGSPAIAGNSSLRTGLVGLWTFDGSSINWSANAVSDGSGTGNTGTLVGMDKSSAVTGKLGQGLGFFTGDWVDMGQPASLKFSGSFSVSGWIKTTSASQGGIFGRWYNTNGNRSYRLFMTGSGVVRLELSNDGTNVTGCSGTTVVNDGAWHHVAVAYSAPAGTVNLYIDGVVENAPAPSCTGMGTSLFDNGASVQIGTSDTDTPANSLSGRLDDVRAYNRALTMAEVKQLYLLGSQTLNASSVALQNGSSLSSGLITHWTLDGADVRDKIYDKSAQGNTAYFNGGATSSAKVAGKLGQGMKFDGVNDYVLGTANINIPKTTVSAWLYLTAVPAQNAVIAGFADGNGGVLYDKDLYVGTDGKLYFYVYDGAGKTTAAPATAIPLNTWVFVTGTADGINARAYVNGAQVGSVAAGNTYTGYPAADILIGGTTATYSGYIQARIDDVRVHNRALSGSEITQLYNLGK